MVWQDFLSTPGAKEYYIRSPDFLDIDAPKSSKVYRNAYRYLDLIQRGQRSGLESPDYAAIIADAKRLDELTKRTPPPQPPPQSPSGRTPRRLYIPGTSYVRFSDEWERRHNFAVDLPDESSEKYQYILDMARSGQYILAIEEAFSISGLNITVAREKLPGETGKEIGRYRATKTNPGIPLRNARDDEVRPVY